MQSTQQWRRAGGVTCLAAAMLFGGIAAEAQSDSQAVQAVWQVQELNLTYMGFTSHYSCDGMRDKVAEWVKSIGAHPSSSVTIAGCDRPSGPAHMPSVRVVLATAATTGSAAASANASDAKRAAALTRINRDSKAPLQDTPFAAHRKTVVLRSKQAIEAGAAGDCELLENFRDQVLKKIDARIVRDNLGCVPHQGTVGNPSLEVEVLVPTAS
jgi:hypothetical protein